MAPANTPAAVVSRLNREVQNILAQTDVKARLAALGLDVAGGSAQDFAALVATDTKRAGDAIRPLGIKVD